MSNPLIESIRDQLADALERARYHQDVIRHKVHVCPRDLSGEQHEATRMMASDAIHRHASARRIGDCTSDFSNSVEYAPALDELYKLLERLGRYMQ